MTMRDGIDWTEDRLRVHAAQADDQYCMSSTTVRAARPQVQPPTAASARTPLRLQERTNFDRRRGGERGLACPHQGRLIIEHPDDRDPADHLLALDERTIRDDDFAIL